MEDGKLEEKIESLKAELLKFQEMDEMNYLLFFKEKEGISRVQKITQISEKLHLLEIKSLSREFQTDNDDIYTLTFPVVLYDDSQCIQVGNHKFMNFDDIYRLFSKNANLENVEKSQMKGGTSLIYAIAKFSSNKNTKIFPIGVLLKYFEEFKNNWNNRCFSKQGIKKKVINRNDCHRAEQIFDKCGINIELKISSDNNEILCEKKI